MVVLNESFQIVDNVMEENIVIRKRGGGCIVKHPPMFSNDGKYIYILCGWCVSAYSVQTGECVHQFSTKSKVELMCSATLHHFLFSVSSINDLIIWNTNEKSSQKVVKLKLEDNAVVVRLYPVTSQSKDDISMVVTVREKNKKQLSVLLYSLTKKKKFQKLYIHAEDKPHSASACEQYAATIVHNRLQVVSLKNIEEKFSTVAGGSRWWTTVACAPEGKGVAVGDNTGRIVVWPDPLKHTKIWVVFHWHSLAVNAITFSPSGSYMYSGGGEGVMVRWNMEVSNMRNFLPRLPAPILHLIVSPDNQSVAISTQDNGIQVADAQNQVTSVIQKLTWGVGVTSGAPLFPAGLLWDPRSRSIVLNGRSGHLQFFNTDDNKLLYNLDITGDNYLFQERHKVMVNTEVSHVAISHDGKWMVTVETRDDRETFLETLIKFWQYKFNARQFSLNSCIQRPHQGRVNTIKFQPPGTLPDHYLLVTTGTDCKFRLWVPSISDSIHSERLHWVCDSTDSYRNLPAECAAFSSDGSVLGITFGASLTLWDADICQLNTSLTRDNNVLKALEFGSQECCHLVVTANGSHLCVWSILTLSVIWTVPLGITLLCADPLSSNMAVFTSNNCVYVFLPSNPKPLFVKKELCQSGCNVLAAIFVPRPQKLMDTSVTWCGTSQLHFIDSNQELQYLELKSEQDPEDIQQWVTTGSTAPVTPFSVLAAEKSSTTVEKLENATHVQFGTSADIAVRKLLSHPPHTMPHIQLFCASFLKALAITRGTEEKKEQQDENKEEVKMDVDDDSDTTVKAFPEQTKTNKRKRKKKPKAKHNKSIDGIEQSPKKEIRENPTKKKQKEKLNKDKKIAKKKESSFSIDDLDSDWLSVLENR